MLLTTNHISVMYPVLVVEVEGIKCQLFIDTSIPTHLIKSGKQIKK